MSSTKWGWDEVTLGPCRLILADCLTVLPTLGRVDAVVTDPPYGHGYDSAKKRWSISTFKGMRPFHGHDFARQSIGDALPFDPTPWLAFPQIILWGAHHYAPHLPNATAWLIWDKRVGGTSDNQSDAELAWTNLQGPVRLYRHLWRGIFRAGVENHAVSGAKLHPHQKPLALMRWCVEKTTGTVLDPYMGSGTTGVACVELGRSFIGIEIDPQYYAIACQRIADALRQPRLFPVLPSSPEQQTLLTDVQKG